jgi:hypothetical protein
VTGKQWKTPQTRKAAGFFLAEEKLPLFFLQIIVTGSGLFA